jgi:hypothetical protein
MAFQENRSVRGKQAAVFHIYHVLEHDEKSCLLPNQVLGWMLDELEAFQPQPS